MGNGGTEGAPRGDGPSLKKAGRILRILLRGQNHGQNIGKRKRKQKNRTRQDSNLRGQSPIDFESIALTTRPRLLLSYVHWAGKNVHQNSVHWSRQKMGPYLQPVLASTCTARIRAVVVLQSTAVHVLSFKILISTCTAGPIVLFRNTEYY